MHLLCLTTRQLQAFLTTYLAEFNVWSVYEYNVSQIPFADLAQYAAATNGSIADLINLYRPPLSTDCISQEDVDIAGEFLRFKGLDDDAKCLQGWMGTSTGGFLDLNINDEILREVLHRDRFRRVRAAGCADVQDVKTAAAAQAEKMADEAEGRCLVTDTTMGTTQEVVPQISSMSGIHVTPRRNRLIQAGVLRDVTEIVAISVPGENKPAGSRQLMTESVQRVPVVLDDSHSNAAIPDTSNWDSDMEINVDQVCRGWLWPVLGYGQGISNLMIQADCKRQMFQVPSSSSMPLTKRRHNAQHGRQTRPMSRPPSQDLRRRISTTQALQSLMNPNGGIQHQSNVLFGSQVGSEISAAVSGGLSAGYQSLSNRPRPPARQIQVVICDAAGVEIQRGTSETPAQKNAFGPQVNSLETNTQLRQELDHRWGQYLRPESKAHRSKGKSGQSIYQHGRTNMPSGFTSAAAAQDDLDYMPGSDSTSKRRVKTQVHKTPVKRKKPSVPPGIPARPRFHDAIAKSSSGDPVQLDLLSLNEHIGGQARATTLDPVDVPSSSRQSVPSPNASLASCPPSKSRKNTEPIFGLQRNQELASPVTVNENAEYAWSAEKAEFAAISQRARFALQADGLVGDESSWGTRDWPKDALKTLAKLKDEFCVMEFQHRGSTTRDAKMSKFAGCADRATFAGQAQEAEFALLCSGRFNGGSGTSCDDLDQGRQD
jgi:hypothetical protein